ncbi:hypothetical protein [Nocardioides zhouii]|uniref:Uncharacterized protein n=1 Tax=Nocardioides zhouii TaxID=1168729 RepID=A0A4Q2SL75_9ACTN|nr:hypothetical protein [Nocardioides zhouii]RYC05731.1 hypothetical protein EUA94_17680 [Nocardioides zhouii]
MALVLSLYRDTFDGIPPEVVDSIHIATDPHRTAPPVYFGATSERFLSWGDRRHGVAFALPRARGISRRAGFVRWVGTHLQVATGDTDQRLHVRAWGAQADLAASYARDPSQFPDPRVLIELGDPAACTHFLVVSPDDDRSEWSRLPYVDGESEMSPPIWPSLRQRFRPVVLCECRRGRPCPGGSAHQGAERRLASLLAMHSSQVAWPPPRHVSAPLRGRDTERLIADRFEPYGASMTNTLQSLSEKTNDLHHRGRNGSDAALVEKLIRNYVVTYPDVADLIAWLQDR